MLTNSEYKDPSQWVIDVASIDPARVFIDSPNGVLYTYEQALGLSSNLVEKFNRLGLKSGDRIAAQVEKSPEAFILYIACLQGGFVYVPLNTAYTISELEYFIVDSDPKLLVCAPEHLGSIKHNELIGRVSNIETLGVDGDGSLLQNISQDAGLDIPSLDHDPSSIAALLYTSGTTGRSKGAMLTRRNLSTNANALVEAWQFSAHDRVLHALPIFHAHGLFIAGNTALAAGASVIFLDRFDTKQIISEMSRASVFMGVPTHYTRLLKDKALTRAATANVRLFVSGSAPLLAETHQEFFQRTGHHVLERYAMTETVVITSNPYVGERRPGAVGFPLPGVRVRLSDPETGTLLPGIGAIGMIEVAGDGRFKGYWRNPEKTAEDIRDDGYFRTGDLGKFDEDGYLHIVGRAKDLIISGGFNVYPKEIETELDLLPEVLESTVIGLPHSDFGEAVTAVVILNASAQTSEQAIISKIKLKLAKYKVPKKIIFTESFPRNALGKIQKNVLRETYKGTYK